MTSLNYFVVLIIIPILTFIINVVLREKLGVESKKFFSYNHVNQKHKKVDWILRAVFIGFLLLMSFYRFEINLGNNSWYMNPGYSAMIFVIISEIVRVIMEWKYLENKKEYIISLVQLIWIIIFFAIVLKILI